MGLKGRRDWVLGQLGIRQWRLKQPIVLKGSVHIVPPDGVRLVVLAQHPPPLSHPFLQDILRACQLTQDQAWCLSIDHAITLPTTCVCWSLGGPFSIHHRSVVQSASLEKLQQSAEAKRQLWQQLCHYADYFTAPSR